MNVIRYFYSGTLVDVLRNPAILATPEVGRTNIQIISESALSGANYLIKIMAVTIFAAITTGIIMRNSNMFRDDDDDHPIEVIKDTVLLPIVEEVAFSLLFQNGVRMLQDRCRDRVPTWLSSQVIRVLVVHTVGLCYSFFMDRSKNKPFLYIFTATTLCYPAVSAIVYEREKIFWAPLACTMGVSFAGIGVNYLLGCPMRIFGRQIN